MKRRIVAGYGCKEKTFVTVVHVGRTYTADPPFQANSRNGETFFAIVRERHMNKQNIEKLKLAFDQILKTAEDDAHIEFCYARDLAKALEYGQWRNFLLVVEKAKIACKNSGIKVSDHFADVSN